MLKSITNSKKRSSLRNIFFDFPQNIKSLSFKIHNVWKSCSSKDNVEKKKQPLERKKICQTMLLRSFVSSITSQKSPVPSSREHPFPIKVENRVKTKNPQTIRNYFHLPRQNLPLLWGKLTIQCFLQATTHLNQSTSHQNPHTHNPTNQLRAKHIIRRM